MSYPDYWSQATKHLSQQCPTMAALIKRYKGEGLRARGDSFYTLLRAVVGQQISVKAADAVWRKLEAAVSPLTPAGILEASEETLRGCGFSGSKVVYAKNLSGFFIDHKVTPGYWDALGDADVIAQLTSIKGIGAWTAEMFLIFHLRRPDIFPVKDLGVLKAIDMHYYPTARKRKTAAQYQRLSKKWAPYRTVATWYLWRALDPVPVEY